MEVYTSVACTDAKFDVQAAHRGWPGSVERQSCQGAGWSSGRHAALPRLCTDGPLVPVLRRHSGPGWRAPLLARKSAALPEEGWVGLALASMVACRLSCLPQVMAEGLNAWSLSDLLQPRVSKVVSTMRAIQQ